MRKPMNDLRVRLRRCLTAGFAIVAIVSLVCMVTLTGCSGDSGPSTDDDTSQQNGVTPLPDDEENGEVAAANPVEAHSQNGAGDPVTGENGEDPNGGAVTREPINGTPEQPVEPPPENGDNGGNGPTLQPAEPEVGPFVPDIQATSPKIVLSTGHEATCKVNVGDKMPDVTLTDVDGNEKSLAALYGKKLTAVLFWTADHPYAKEQFERIEREIAKPYGKYGVATVTINEGNAPEAIKAIAGQPDVGYPMLLDAEGAALAAVATEKLPRTYLLDASGEILWFDLEYSESTRRELKNAIVWHLTR